MRGREPTVTALAGQTRQLVGGAPAESPSPGITSSRGARHGDRRRGGCTRWSREPLHEPWEVPELHKPTSSADKLLEHRDTVIRAARRVDPRVAGLEAKKSGWWIKIFAIPVARYQGKGSSGTETLREKIEAENEGFMILSTIR